MKQSQSTILSHLLKMPENMECADCNQRYPKWASTTLGVFVCIKCAGMHRKLGTHITLVKSTNLDKWSIKMLKTYEQINNKVMNSYWESNLLKAKQCNFSDTELWQFVNEKYVMKKYVRPDIINPINRVAEPVYPKSVMGMCIKETRDSNTSFDEGTAVNKLPLSNITNRRGNKIMK